MFKFSFLESTNNEDRGGDDNAAWTAAEEIALTDHNVLGEICSDIPQLSLFHYGSNSTVKHVSSNAVIDIIKKHQHNENSSIFRAENEHSDLLTAVYEGGFKIWECTQDLANYIHNQDLCFRNTKVLDLGCGAGILGIIAVVNGATAYFQDYNKEVVKFITIPNLALNLELNTEDKMLSYCRFYSGDWKSFLQIMESNFRCDDDKFDYIFSSETIYNPSNYKKLHAVFKHCLKANGVVYLAAKLHYFGVGGGMKQFEDLVLKENVFNCSTCWKCLDGVQREILRLSFKR